MKQINIWLFKIKISSFIKLTYSSNTYSDMCLTANKNSCTSSVRNDKSKEYLYLEKCFWESEDFLIGYQNCNCC